MAFKQKEGLPSSETIRTLQTIFKPGTSLECVKGLKIGIYSRSKIGKTHFALTAPAPRYVIDTENAYQWNLRQFPVEHRAQTFVSEVLEEADYDKKKGVDIFKSLDLTLEAIDLLTQHIMELEETDPNGPRGTIIIDSASDIWDWLSMWIEEYATRTSGGNVNRLEWGKANKKYNRFMRMLLSSDWNVVWTFRSEPAVDDKGRDMGYDKVRWQKKTDFWLSLITELKMEGVDVVMKFRGDRFGRIQEDLVNPNWDSLCKHLTKHSGVQIV